MKNNNIKEMIRQQKMMAEERKEMVNHNAHANIKSNSKMANNNGDSKIADNILQKLNEREKKDK